MITFIRTLDAKTSDPAVFEAAVDISNYILENYTRIKSLHVATTVGGKMSQIHWIGVHENLDSVEALLQWMATDPGFMEKVIAMEKAEMFIQGSGVDQLMAHIS